MTETSKTQTIPVDEVEAGIRVLYPHLTKTAIEDRPVTVSGIVEYPNTRLLYFAEGGSGIADRTVSLRLAEEA